MRIFILILSCFFSLQASAQECTLKLGDMDACHLRSVNLKDVLLNPKLTCADSTGKVKYYSVSVYINEKLELDGPYQVKSEEFTREAIDMLKRYIGYSGTLYIDDIKIVGTDKRMRVWSPIKAKFSR
jgi:hypothetical protein